MNNKFIEELGQKPIVNTFKFAYQMFISNIWLFVMVSAMSIVFVFYGVYISFKSIDENIEHILMVIPTIIAIMIIFQIFMVSSYFYMSKLVLESSSEIECAKKIASTRVSTLFFEYFMRALGSTLAMLVMGASFMVIREIIDIYSIVFLIPLTLSVYISPIVGKKITLSNNMGESFMATFLVLSPSIWKKGFRRVYVKSFTFLSQILGGIFFLIFLINYNLDLSTGIMKYFSEGVIMTFSIFTTLYVWPIYSMIAYTLVNTETEGK